MRCMSHACLLLSTRIGGGPRGRLWSRLSADAEKAERWRQRRRGQGSAVPRRGGNAGQGEAAGGQRGSGQDPHRRRTGSPRVSGAVAADREAHSAKGGELRPQVGG